MQNTHGITIDRSALEKIAALRKAGTPDFPATAYLRVAIEGGGCSGFQYKIEAAAKPEPDDLVFEDAVLIDDSSAPLMKNAVIRYQNDMMGAMFVVDNPNAASSCGCKSSFSIDPETL